ncbi:MAG: hypothetical protein MJ164_02755 [Alphaproteobacteria bacterium]|nr:hypothetical protein [Alphaproteobacteria bacterium]
MLLKKFLCQLTSKKHKDKKSEKVVFDNFPIVYSNGNKVILHTESGKIITNPQYVHGLKINFYGSNSTVELFFPINFVSCEFSMGDDCNFIIHKSHHICLRVDAYNQSSLFIDEDTQIGTAHVHMMNERETSLHIGKHVVFSYGIQIYTTDTHPIMDLNGNIINNTKSSVIIGDHVWIGAFAVLLKGAQIAPDSVVGHSAVVAKKFTDKNVVIAGNPAKIIKTDINWRGGVIS